MAKRKEELVETKLDVWKRVKEGELENGVKYKLLRNTTPPNKAQAYLRVNVGSVDEEEDEQGLAHFLEHVVFLGTEKFHDAQTLRELLAQWGMNFGGDANATTDFRETIYSLQVPIPNNLQKRLENSSSKIIEDEEDSEEESSEEEDDEEDSDDEEDEESDSDTDEHDKVNIGDEDHQKKENHTLWKALEVLYELGSKAKLIQNDIEIEKGAVLSELREGNNLEYRVFEKWFNQILPPSIANRFPIGKKEQIENFTNEHFRKFYETHYRPQNFTIFVVGQINYEQTEEWIKQIFGNLPSAPSPLPVNPIDPKITYLPPKIQFETFFHELESNFQLSFTSVSPIPTRHTYRDILREYTLEILDNVISSRLEARLLESDDLIYNNIYWDLESNYNQGCQINSFVIDSKPEKWKIALNLAFKECQKLVEFGISQEELDYCISLVKQESKEEAEQTDTTTSIDLIDQLVELSHLGYPITSKRQNYQIFKKIYNLITVEMVNEAAKVYFDFVNFKKVRSTDRKADQIGFLGDRTSVFLSAPKEFESTFSVWETIEEVLDQSTSQIEVHVFPNIPSFLIAEKTIPKVNDFTSYFVQPEVDFNVKSHLLPPFVSFDPQSTSLPFRNFKIPHFYNKDTGVILLNLKNGIKVTLKKTDFEAKQCSLSINSKGGAMSENRPKHFGISKIVNAAAFGDSFAHSAEVIHKFTNLYGISFHCKVYMESTNIRIDFSVIQDGLKRGFDFCRHFLLNIYGNNEWDSKYFKREVKGEIVSRITNERELDSFTTIKIKDLLFANDERFQSYSTDLLQQLELSPDIYQYVRDLLSPSNLEFVFVGDFDEHKIIPLIAEYLGTLQFTPHSSPSDYLTNTKINFPSQDIPTQLKLHLDDEAERAFVKIGLLNFNSWGKLHDYPIKPLEENDPEYSKRSHPLYPYRVYYILGLIINNRLFKDIREKRGLLYSATFSDVCPLRLEAGYSIIYLSPFPDKIDVTIQHVIELLNDVKAKNISQAEFDEAQKPLIEEIKSNLFENSFWVEVCANLHAGWGSHPNFYVKLADFYANLTLNDVFDVIERYPVLILDPHWISIGTSGSINK